MLHRTEPENFMAKRHRVTTDQLQLLRELEREAVVAENATTAADGKTYQVEFFNLDAIISVGYRVNSKRDTPRHRPLRVVPGARREV
jgi:hypothetical protein